MTLNRIAFSLLSGIVAFAPLSALAGSYQALCNGGVKCSVNVSSREISSPQGTIPVSRVSYWSVNGQSSTSVGTGIATTLLFGGIGLLGFLAKNHDYNFSVDGYDVDGKKVSLQFKFINDKPVKSITGELYSVSGLAMGRQRSIAEIKAIEAGEAPLNSMSAASDSLLQSTSMKKALSCASVLRDFECNYDEYLQANPSVMAWAEANPLLAEKERIRLGAYSQEEIAKQKAAQEKTTLNAMPSLGKFNDDSGGV